MPVSHILEKIVYKFLKCIALTLSMTVGFSAQAALEGRVVTEEYPPYNFMENGKLVGLSTEVVHEMFVKAGTTPQIEVLPWPRAYNEALTEPNSLIYTISRTPQREALFKWIGSIINVNTSFYKLKSNTAVTINSIEEAKKYTVTGIQQEVSTQWLEKNNFKITAYSSGYANILKMLTTQRVDLMLIDDIVFATLIKQEKLNANDYEKVFVVKDLLIENCIATSVKTEDAVVDKYKKLLEEVKASAKYQEILNKYFK